MPKHLATALLALVALVCPAFAWAGPPIIVGTQMAAPGTLDLVLESTNTESTAGGVVPDTINVTPSSYSIDGQQPSSVSRYSLPREAGPAVNNAAPVTVRHHLFINLATPLTSGTSHNITSPYGNTQFTYSDTGTYCSAIHVAQGGYSSLATVRYANFAVWNGSGGSIRFTAIPAYRVVNESTGATVFSGTASREFDDTTGPAASGAWTYRLPLDAVPNGGPYYVVVASCGRSRSFTVGTRISAYTIIRGLLHQRCGQELAEPYTHHTRPACHTRIYDTRTPWVNDHLVVPQDAGVTTLDRKGLYHDAGDFDVRPMHTIIPIILLNYFEAWPSHFASGQLNLPDQGTAPDFLKEALWGVLGWQYLQVTTPGDPQLGGTRSGFEQAGHPVYSQENAATDRGIYGSWSVDGAAGTAAEGLSAFVAGTFAQASRLVRPYDPARADLLRDRALLAWAYVTRTYNMNATNAYLMYGSLQMYLLTGDAAQHDLFKRLANSIVVNGGSWPTQWLSGNNSATVNTSHFVGYLLNHGRPTDPALVTALKARIFSEADRGGYFSLAPANTAWPFLAPAFISWGSESSVRFDAPAWASLFTSDPAKKQQYINTMSLMMDWVTGLNPMNMAFVTGVGTDAPRNPGHLDSYFTEQRGLSAVPGLSLYGITSGWSGQNYQLAISNKIYPDKNSLPTMKRYADAWLLLGSAEFSTWETIVYNAAVAGFLYDASQAAPPPPPLDAGTVADASVDASADAAAPPDSGVAVDASRDTGVDASVDSGPVDAGPVLMCIQPPPPPPICGPAYPYDAGTAPTLLMRRATHKRLVH